MPKTKAPNKRKAKLTLAKYRDINNKKIKSNTPESLEVGTQLTVPSNSNLASSLSLNAILIFSTSEINLKLLSYLILGSKLS